MVSNLLNSFDVSKLTGNTSTEIDKGQAGQQYQGYYPSYQPYGQQQRAPMVDNRWMGGYQSHQMNQGQQHQQQQVYNPLNPMANKYPVPQPPSNPMGMYKNNPMMMNMRPQGQQGQQGQGNQGQQSQQGYYDPRYQDYRQQ